MSVFEDPKPQRVEVHLEPPFEEVTVTVNPVADHRKPDEPIYHRVLVGDNGEYVSTRLEYAEAEAKAVLKAIRSYRRKYLS